MAQAEQTPVDLKVLKEQAERLSSYLGGIGRKVTSQQALEAMTRALYGRPYNTVKASASTARRQASKARSQGFWYHDLEFDDLLPVSAPISLASEHIIFGVTVTAYLAQASDEELKSFLDLAWLPENRVGADCPRPWFLEQLMMQDSPFASLETAETVKAMPTEYTKHGVLAYFKAFHPERYLQLVRTLVDGSQPEGHPWLRECEVNEDPDQPGSWLWVCREPFDACDASYRSRVEAEVALADAWLESNPELFAMQHLLKRIQPGSGVQQ